MNVVGLHSRFQISPLLGHLVGQFLPLQVSGIESIPQDFRDEGANIIHLFFPPNHGGEGERGDVDFSLSKLLFQQ
jgi:hypothetical protein